MEKEVHMYDIYVCDSCVSFIFGTMKQAEQELKRVKKSYASKHYPSNAFQIKKAIDNF